MIDTHCHIDLFPNPHQIAEYSERNDILTIGVTNLPSHFELGFPHIQQYKKVRLALGLHPLYAEKHSLEYKTFKRNVDKTIYIGEVGLDYSREGIHTKELQIQSFRFVLQQIGKSKKFITIHSRRAEQEVLDLLLEYEIPIAAFHWYSGSKKVLRQIIDSGYYFSINPAMIKSKTGKEIIKAIPKHLILTESDGPFIEFNRELSQPKHVRNILQYLAKLYNINVAQIDRIIYNNFKRILNSIRGEL